MAKGAKLELNDVKACYVATRCRTTSSASTMGVDVGKWYHWVASEWDRLPGCKESDPLGWRRRVVAVGRCMTTYELGKVMDQMSVQRCVIDAQPETREIKRLQVGRRSVWLGWTKELSDTLRVRESIKQVDCNRTEWLDTLFDRVRQGQRLLTIPCDAGKDLEDHLQVPVRVYVRDKMNNEIARYQSSEADHYAFAMMYDEVAHHLGFIGERPLEATRKEVATEETRPRISDPKRYAEEVLAKLTGFRKR